MKTHRLKTHPEFFKALRYGRKKFEVRKNDRDFKPGDQLELAEYDPRSDSFSGEVALFMVSYILEGGQFGIEPGYVVMSLDDSPF